MKSLIQIQKKCEWCDSIFIAQKCSTRFCCKRCAEHAYKDRLRKQRVAKYQLENSQNEQPSALEKVTEKEFLRVSEAAALLGVDRVTIYRYLWDELLPCRKLRGKTLIRRSDIEKLFDTAAPYVKRHKREATPITEFYTTAEVEEKFGVSTSWVFKVGKEENIPKTINRGKTMWSKKHFDAYFAGKAPSEEITEWYAVEEMKQKFGMTNSAVYSFVSKYSIPKKKVKRGVFYSKKHVDIAKGIAVAEEPQYYTIKEAMEKYQLTRDQLYHYVKWHKIPKVQEGKYVKISRKELDALLAPPII